MEKESLKKVAFLDRDGTLNVDYGYVHTKEKFELIEGVEEGLKVLQSLGYSLVIISNQSGIGRGFFSETEYLDFQNFIKEYLEKLGINVLASYYCPHVSSDNCNCRKPKTGLFEKASKDLHIDWSNSIAIGDRYRDLTICKEKGIRGFFIKGTEKEQQITGITSVDSLLQAAMTLKNVEGK